MSTLDSPHPTHGRNGGLLVFILLLPLILIFLFPYLLFGLLLQVAIWTTWWPRGKYVLFVYSDSPIWKDYVQTNILPRLGKSAIVLNWSERRTWKRLSLASLAFRYFGGAREFNPMAVVFRPLRWAKVLRFYKPFQDHKHGKTMPLERMQDALFAATILRS